jgi:hypothetical protein
MEMLRWCTAERISRPGVHGSDDTARSKGTIRTSAPKQGEHCLLQRPNAVGIDLRSKFVKVLEVEVL